MKIHPPIHFQTWIEEHRHLLKPPVGNQQVWEDGDFIVMVVGGPNARKDFHYNEGPEFFYQLEGDIVVRIKDEEGFRDIPIREGEIFLLPPKVPHSPQRPANTIGLVIEQKRPPEQMDAFLWFCEACGELLYKHEFHLKNIVSDLPKIFDTFYSSEELRTCKKCGAVMEPPQKR